MNCVKCNKELNKELAFCINCGHDITPKSFDGKSYNLIIDKEKIKSRPKLIILSIIIIFFLGIGITITRQLIFEAPQRAVTSYYKAIEDHNFTTFVDLMSKNDDIFASLDNEKLNDLIIEMNEYYTEHYGGGWSDRLGFETISKEASHAKLVVKIKDETKEVVEPKDDAWPMIPNDSVISSPTVIKENGKWVVKLSSI